MANNLLPDLPDDARIWIFVLDGQDCQSVIPQVEEFLASWVSHGRSVEGRVTLMHDRFLVVGGRIHRGQVSGCSIDAMTRAVTDAAHDAGCKVVSPMNIIYRNADGQVGYTSRPGFRQLLNAGEVTPATPVFNLAVDTLQSMRGGEFQRPLGHSAFARAFRIQPE